MQQQQQRPPPPELLAGEVTLNNKTEPPPAGRSIDWINVECCVLQRIARESADRHENPTQNIIRARPELNSPRHRPLLCVVYAVRVWQVHYTQIHSSAACLAQGGGDCLSGCGLGRSGFRTSGVEQNYTPRVVAFGGRRVFGRCVYKHTKRNNRNSVVCAFIPWPPPPPSSQSFYALRHRRQTTDVWGLGCRVSDG